MKSRLSLSAKIMLLALVNLALLVGAFVLVAKIYYSVELTSVLFAPARDRVVAVAREIELNLDSTPPPERTALMGRFAALYGADFYLFKNDGHLLAGRSVALPSEVFEELSRGQREGADDDKGSRRPRRPRRQDDKGPPPDEQSPPPPPNDDPRPPGRPPQEPGRMPVFQISASDLHWVGVRMPIPAPDEGPPIRGTLLIAAKSFYGTPLFFDYKPWLVALFAAIAVFAICWLPFIRSLTRSISSLTVATERISQGSFELNLKEDRSDELGTLAGAINRMTERLSGFVSGQKRFLGDIAHELCAPLARIQFGLGILEQRASEEQLGAVADVQDEVRQMSELVSELLSFSKAGMEAARRPLTKVDVAEAVRRAVERENTGTALVRVEIQDAISAQADQMMLVRAISNVVRNAIRYAGDAGPITITAARTADAVTIHVTDCGPGLAAEDLDRVFTPFYRPEASRNRATGGAGLGLAIVKSCIEACQGTVECRNRPEGGLEVDFRLKPGISSA